MKTKPKRSARNYLFAIIGSLVLCIGGFCVIVIFSPDPVSPPASTSAPIETIIEETANAARVETLSVPTDDTPRPTIESPLTSTPVVLPATSPIPTQNSSPSATLAACIQNRNAQTGTVTDVVDGDTIKVRLDADGLTYSVRYIGIDTPESTIQHEPFGKEASEKNAELVSGKQVFLYKDVSETDKYNRLLRYVFTDEYFVNYELVKQGFANAVTYPPDIACADYFREGESYAKDLLLGLWAFQPTATSVSIGGTTSQQTIIITAVNKQAEYVDIKNVSAAPINLQGWTLISEKGNQACGLGGTIQPGETLRIWAGTNATGFSCGFGSNIWNNSESDPAVLYDPQGREVDRY